MKITKKSKSNVRKNKDAKKMKKPQAKIQAKIIITKKICQRYEGIFTCIL